MSMTETEIPTNTGATSPRRTANGGASSAEAPGETKRQLKAKAEEIRTAASERLSQARTKAATLAQDARLKATEAGKGAVAHAKQHPVQTALIAAGALAAGLGVAAMLRNHRSRHIAARTAKTFWSDYGKILLPLATALAVPGKAIADKQIPARGSKLIAAMPKAISRHFH